MLSLLEQMRMRRSYSMLAYRWSMLLTSTATKYSVRFLCKGAAHQQKVMEQVIKYSGKYTRAEMSQVVSSGTVKVAQPSWN